jgi:hypothetical protein
MIDPVAAVVRGSQLVAKRKFAKLAILPEPGQQPTGGAN